MAFVLQTRALRANTSVLRYGINARHSNHFIRRSSSRPVPKDDVERFTEIADAEETSIASPFNNASQTVQQPLTNTKSPLSHRPHSYFKRSENAEKSIEQRWKDYNATRPNFSSKKQKKGPGGSTTKPLLLYAKSEIESVMKYHAPHIDWLPYVAAAEVFPMRANNYVLENHINWLVAPTQPHQFAFRLDILICS
jgi:hypothetical protein